jgi:hypothetical protein
MGRRAEELRLELAEFRLARERLRLRPRCGTKGLDRRIEEMEGELADLTGGTDDDEHR